MIIFYARLIVYLEGKKSQGKGLKICIVGARTTEAYALGFSHLGFLSNK